MLFAFSRYRPGISLSYRARTAIDTARYLGLTSEPIPYMFEERTTNNGHDVLAKVYLYGNTRAAVMIPC
jgi:hypothetical protein